LLQEFQGGKKRNVGRAPCPTGRKEGARSKNLVIDFEGLGREDKGKEGDKAAWEGWGRRTSISQVKPPHRREKPTRPHAKGGDRVQVLSQGKEVAKKTIRTPLERQGKRSSPRNKTARGYYPDADTLVFPKKAYNEKQGKSNEG